MATTVSAICTLVEPGSDRVGVLAQAITARGYSAAEIELIRREAPYANHYGPHVRLDVIDTIVKDHRRVRSMLTRALSGDEVAEVCGLDPSITPDDFACANYDARNNPLWRYAPDVARRARERGIVANPETPEAVGRKEGPVTLNLIAGRDGDANRAA